MPRDIQAPKLSPIDAPVADEELVVRAKAGDAAARNDLLRRFSTTLHYKANAYLNAPIPAAAIEGEAMKLLLQAIDKFNPGMGLKFKTLLEQMLKGLYRYVATNKNIARIPEHQVLQISRFNSVKDILRAAKDRDPTPDEIADAIGWSVTQVVKMESSLSRRSIAMSGIEAKHGVEDLPAKISDVVEFEYFSMTPEEKIVYDLSIGAHGKKQMTNVAAIAKAAGTTPDKVYAIKRVLARKIASRI